MAELQAEDEKKRAYEIHMAERADEIKIQIAQTVAAKEQAKIDKQLKIKEMELQAQQAQAQANTSPAATLTPLIKKSPKLPSFIDEKEELHSYLLCFEPYAENASWEKLRTHGLLS